MTKIYTLRFQNEKEEKKEPIPKYLIPAHKFAPKTSNR